MLGKNKKESLQKQLKKLKDKKIQFIDDITEANNQITKFKNYVKEEQNMVKLSILKIIFICLKVKLLT